MKVLTGNPLQTVTSYRREKCADEICEFLHVGCKFAEMWQPDEYRTETTLALYKTILKERGIDNVKMHSRNRVIIAERTDIV